jgi:phenol hydroxylase P4 protein
MAVKSIGTYDFPSKSREELYGDDMLVHVWWKDNPMFVAAACFRAPKAMSWGDFRGAILDPWAHSDPDYDPAHAFTWELDGAAFTPEDSRTLAELGIAHKHVVAMFG